MKDKKPRLEEYIHKIERTFYPYQMKIAKAILDSVLNEVEPH